MARYHFADVEDQRDEHAHDVRRDEYQDRWEASDFDERPDPEDLVGYVKPWGRS